MSCCGPNPRCACKPLKRSEMPDERDLARFGGDDITCPNCGTDVYHDAPLCHACGYAILDTKSTRTKLVPIVATLVAAGMILWFVGWML